jgi:NAD(P)-dependent dehydrogenase (short-subunit alcohol dehydrogenase family)
MEDVLQIFDLTGKTAVVTGTSAGIGNRMARTLVLAGATVVGIARRTTELDADVVATGRLISVTADLAETDQVLEAAEASLEALDGRVDILVNNAGWLDGGVRAEDETYAGIRRTIAINQEAPFLLAQRFLPGMKASGAGSIVNISSLVAHTGVGSMPQATYAATKGALEAMTRELAAQWSPDGIRVNCIAPGWIETEITGPVIHQESVQRWILRNSLIQRHGQPDDFDGPLLLLASDAGRYITGACIVVDGGWTAH